MFKTALLVFLLFAARFSHAQCASGSIGITGGGCLSGCNLTAYGGPNCSPPVSGNTSTQIVSVAISVPAGCTYTVNALMAPRPGCSASGADGGDGMKVDVAGGSKPYLTTGSNGTLNDAYTLSGPGTIEVFCRADRQDEIVTYSISGSGASCVNCNSVLPVTLLSFDAKAEANAVRLDWVSAREVNNDYYTVERSADGMHFTTVALRDGAGNSETALYYTLFDVDPLPGISYYRLRQTDFDGKETVSEIRSVVYGTNEGISIYPNPANRQFTLRSSERIDPQSICFYTAGGKQVEIQAEVQSNFVINYQVADLPAGFYFARIVTGNHAETIRFTILHK